MEIAATNGKAGLDGAQAVAGGRKTETGFKEIVKGAVERVNELDRESDRSITELLTEKNTPIHTTMLALQKADISIRLLLSVRNKAIEAYKEIMHMQF